jgi:hypothetical protein
VAVATALLGAGGYGKTIAPSAAHSSAESLARRAIALDPADAEAHSTPARGVRNGLPARRLGDRATGISAYALGDSFSQRARAPPTEARGVSARRKPASDFHGQVSRRAAANDLSGGDYPAPSETAATSLWPSSEARPVGYPIRAQQCSRVSTLPVRAGRAKLDKAQVRSGLAAGGRWIRTSSSGASGEADAILPVKDRPR